MTGDPASELTEAKSDQHLCIAGISTAVLGKSVFVQAKKK